MPTPRHKITCAILAVAASVFAISKSHAGEANLQDCKKLQQEHVALSNQGIQKDLQKGPEWARSNLPANRVTQVLRYLHIYEQIRFRCEYVFAAADAQALEHQAQEAARLRALANVPPPPERRPKQSYATAKTSTNAVPPLPTRRDP